MTVSAPQPAVIALVFVVALALSVAACGGDDGPDQQAEDATATQTTSAEQSAGDEQADEAARRPGGEAGLRVPAERARIVADESDLGRVLFDANGQVVYVFEIDDANRSNCTSAECVKAWPPVLTREQPSAGPGVDAELLGTIRRGDGALQL
jgi:hypothetical protein